MSSTPRSSRSWTRRRGTNCSETITHAFSTPDEQEFARGKKQMLDSCPARSHRTASRRLIMESTKMKTLLRECARSTCVLFLCAALTAPGMLLFAQTPPASGPAPQESKIPAGQLDALVAPIALYPDNLMTQVLIASTYPLEIIQLHQ